MTFLMGCFFFNLFGSNQFYTQTHHSTPHSVHSLPPHSRDFIRDNKDYYYRDKDRDTRREHFRDHRGPSRYIARSRTCYFLLFPTLNIGVDTSQRGERYNVQTFEVDPRAKNSS